LRKNQHEKERPELGAALLSALMIVSMMSLVALAVIESLRFSITAATNIEQREQVRLYALGAEQLAISTLEASIQTRKKLGVGNQRRREELDQWTQKPLVFPIDGGMITGRVKDGANCFNLNALVSSDQEGTFVTNSKNVEMFANLL
jgi:general secretion pathway protein K